MMMSSFHSSKEHLDLNRISSILEQMKDVSIQAQPFLSCLNFKQKNPTSYNQLLQTLNSLVELCQETLSTHYDIVMVRFALLHSVEPMDSFQIQDGRDLATLLVQLLYTCTQVWLQSMDWNDDCGTTMMTQPHNNRVADTNETKLLLSILSFLYHIATMDCVLGEEVARAGCHSILSQLIQYDTTSLLHTLNEPDEDAIYEIQDWACSIGHVPVFIHSLTFPVKTNPYSPAELIHRLPMPFVLQHSSSSSSSLTCLSHDLSNPIENNLLDLDLSSPILLWIQHITERQSEQYDVGFVTWPSSVALSLYLIHHSKILLNQMILEVGAGTGLVGIVAAKLLASYNVDIDNNGVVGERGRGRGRVIVSDFNPLVLDNIKRNILLNNLQPFAETSCLDFYHQDGNNYDGGWFETTSPGHVPQLSPREAVDIVLAADVICQPSDSVSLSKTIYDALKPGGKAFVTSAAAAHRFGVECFPSECVKRGLIVSVESSLVPDGIMNGLYLKTSGFVEGMELKLYEIVKPLRLL